MGYLPTFSIRFKVNLPYMDGMGYEQLVVHSQDRT